MAIKVDKPGRNLKPSTASASKDAEGGGAGSAPPTVAEQPAADSGPKVTDVPDRDWDILNIPLDQIAPNPYNLRDMGDLEEIAESLKQPAGLLEPVSVMHREEFARFYPEAAESITQKYVLGFGERRWRSHFLAGLRRIRAVLRDDLAPTIREELIKENWHRKQPTEYEEALQFGLFEGMSVREIARRLNIKSHSTVQKRLDLLKLPQELQQAMAKKELGYSDARKLLGFEDKEQAVQAWELVRGKDMTLDDAMRHVLLGHQRGAEEEESLEAAKPEVEVERPTEVDEAEAETASEAVAAAPPAAEPAVVSTPAEPRESAAAAPAAAEASAAPAQPRPAPAAPVQSRAEKAEGKRALERRVASADREQACISLLSDPHAYTLEGVDGVISRALLGGTNQAARVRAHDWLQKAGQAGISVKDPESYFEAVLSSKSADLIHHASLATALATGEGRAADRRRPNWDAHDAAHVQFLITAAGYVPETAWERESLTRLGVALSEAARDEAELTDQESL